MTPEMLRLLKFAIRYQWSDPEKHTPCGRAWHPYTATKAATTRALNKLGALGLLEIERKGGRPVKFRLESNPHGF